MKKTILLSIAIAALGMTACNNSNANKAASGQNIGANNKDILYSGILPAADAQGTLCTLKLDYDDDHNYTDGDFLMIENSLASDTISAAGLKEVATSLSEGDFRKLTKQIDGKMVEYLILTPDTKDLLGAATADPTYLIINPDQSLTLVNSNIELPENPELYTLTVK